MNVFVCKTNGCTCHPKGMILSFAFNRGHAVKLMNKRLEEANLPPLPRDREHEVEALDPESPVFKKGYADLSWALNEGW